MVMESNAEHLKQPLQMNYSEISMKITPDQAAAHQFLAELRTRVSTQPLPYQHGVEARALESMWEVFGHARDAIKKNPGCDTFAISTTDVLNRVVRPLTAKWHRAYKEGRLNGRDGADEFRGELQNVQKELRAFAAELHEMAYGKPHTDALTPEVITEKDLDALFKPLPFGFASHHPDLEAKAVDIARDENDAVTTRRKKKNIVTPTGNDAIGLALSGGGIRSATFSLGVVQVLADKGYLQEVDFLSTVSGGGYTGCFLTQRLGNDEVLAEVAVPHGPDPDPVRHLRQHAKYLSVNNLKEKWSMVTATLAGMLLNWTVPLVVIVSMAFIASKFGPDLKKIWPTIFWISVVTSILAIVIYGLGMRIGRKFALVAGWILGVVLALSGIIGAGWLFGSTLPALFIELRGQWGRFSSLGVVLVVVTAAVPGIIRFVPVLKEPKVRKVVLKIALVLAGLLVPVTALLLFYFFGGIGDQQFAIKMPEWVASVLGIESLPFLVWFASALAAVAFFVLNINLTGPHRFYRDCLARTFIQKSPADTADVKLKEINAQGTAPYQIINAALNVPTSKNPALKDRSCDFFMFSKLWTGSAAAGYFPTEKWMANRADVDLATAMAVSGAAFSSHMGLGSMPMLTALLSVLNVRLGFWIKKPPAKGWLDVPGFLCLFRETLSICMSEKQKWLNLSDGGHIENLAVYELLRRRCKFIICVDGESDPTFTFHGLMTVVRHAQIDFGVQIAPMLDDLRPDPKTGYSTCHYHLCHIQYPEGMGLLLYIKLSVTGNESELIRRYRINNPEFPHQTTLDQFFDQEQFEAYRQLGVHAAEGLFLPALMDASSPPSVPLWFRQLAKNLLDPIKLRSGYENTSFGNRTARIDDFQPMQRHHPLPGEAPVAGTAPP